GTEAVEAIFLDTSKIGKVDLGPDVFKEMHNLRVLDINDRKKRKFKLKQLWNGVQHLQNLKHINLSYSKHLIQIPHLSRAPKLETGSTAENYWTTQGIFTRKPGSLNLDGCSSLKTLQNISGNKFPELPKNIVTLDLSGTAIEEVPSSIKNVSALEVFRLPNCKRLKDLPTSIWITGLPRISFVNLIKLRCPLLNECEKLAFVPHSIFCMSSVEELSFSNCPLLELLPTMSKIGLETFVLFLSGLNMMTTLNMSNCSLLKLPDWLACLSSLKTLELSGNLIDEIPKSVKKLNGSIELHISNCGNLPSLPELPLSLGYLDVSGCTSLETVWNPETKLVQCLWDDYHVTYYKEFPFCDCSKLDQNALKNITTESQIRILRTAIVSVLEPIDVSVLFDQNPFASICCPGNEIPKWFNYQSGKSSMTIKLTPDWHENSFIGFALSTVVAFEDSYFEGEYIDHVFMWYNYEDYHKYLGAVEVSFEFCLIEYDNVGNVLNSCNDKLRKCGVRLLHLGDAEEFGIDTNPPYPFEELDA
ncbi:hypothetical protein TorRG33x02_340790, partial [Trema orientale]